LNKEVVYFASQPTLKRNRVSGYAATFGPLSCDRGGYHVRLLPGCFSRSLETVDCTLNLDHDDKRLLGRTLSGTLRLEQTDTGLYYEADLPNTTTGQDARELLERKDYQACSFAVSGMVGTFLEENDIIVYEVADIAELFDVSLVVRPAFPKTEVNLHAFEAWQRHRPKPLLLQARLRQLMALSH